MCRSSLQAWGAGVLTGASGRGSVPEDDELCIGNFAADEALAEVIGSADCLLTVGSHLRGNYQLSMVGDL